METSLLEKPSMEQMERSNKSCSICDNKLEDQRYINNYFCNHGFHYICLLKYLLIRKPKCYSCNETCKRMYLPMMGDLQIDVIVTKKPSTYSICQWYSQNNTFVGSTILFAVRDNHGTSNILKFTLKETSHSCYVSFADYNNPVEITKEQLRKLPFFTRRRKYVFACDLDIEDDKVLKLEIKPIPKKHWKIVLATITLVGGIPAERMNDTWEIEEVHAIVLEEILPKLKPGARILDIGSGSGYLTACFAKKMGIDGIVVGIDHIEELVNKSITTLNKIPEMQRLLESGNLLLKTGDGRNGYTDLAPFDAIHIGAAPEAVPEKLLEQLNIGGILISPVGKPNDQYLTKILKLYDGSFTEQRLMAVRYVPLTNKSGQLRSEL